ncbi:hypothetical protein MRX96_055523 [Rhipicephalus microplus]
MSSSSLYSMERSCYDWDSSGTTSSDPPASHRRLFVVVTRDRDTVRLDLTCYSFALAFLVVTVVSMVLFAARHRRRLLNEDSLIVDSEDRDGVKGEAALREASRRKRNEDASATRSRTTRRKLATGVAIAGRRARDSVVPISKKITVPWTLSQPSSGKLHRKVAGDPREGELGWKDCAAMMKLLQDLTRSSKLKEKPDDGLTVTSFDVENVTGDNILHCHKDLMA